MSGIAVGVRVRIVAGQAAGIEGVVVAEYVPLKPRAWRTWTLRTEDLVRRREIREDYLEPIGDASDEHNQTGAE